jgi:hypothetical protein
MKVTQLRLAAQGAWPELLVDRFSPELNVLFGPPRAGKSTVAQLAAHLLYGKGESAWRRQFGQATPLAEGALEVESPQGAYLLRRHRDGTPQGRLSIAATTGGAVDGRTIRSLLEDVPPRVLAELYAVDFARPPSPSALLGGDFAREFTLALAQERRSSVGHADDQSLPVGLPASRSRIDDLVRRRDGLVLQIEGRLSAGRRESEALEQQLREVETALIERREAARQLEARLRAVEAKLAANAASLRYFALESAARRGADVDADKQQAELEQIEAEIARCRQTLADLQLRDATVRRQRTEVHPDGPVDGPGCLADQRATVGAFEQLLDDLDAEVSQLAGPRAPGPWQDDFHARLTPLAQMLRQQLYVLCGQVAEHERWVRREQLDCEARQLARTQTDVSEQLQHLLGRRQSLLHAAEVSQRPTVLIAHAPAPELCQCHGHGEFVRDSDAMLLARSDRRRREATMHTERTDLERDRNALRADLDAAQRDVDSLDARWQLLQRQRAGAAGRATLDQLRAELDQLESKIHRSLSDPEFAGAAAGPVHRQPWKASAVLTQLTGGRLVEIRTQREGRGATVIDREGRTLSPEQLSPAQQDQLHLALVLALSSSLANRGVDLPLLLDEPFLRQDERGAAAMAGVIEEFARQGRQVIVFTEDREAKRRFEALGVEVRRLDDLRQRSAAAHEAPAPVEPAAQHAGGVRIVREVVGSPKPQLRVTGEWTHAEEPRDVYFLTPEASMDDFPVLGNETASVFAGLDIRTIEDLLRADAASLACRLGRPAVGAETIRLWQSHMSLMCYVPELSLNDAQVLAANDVGSPDALLGVDVRLLAGAIEKFLASDAGRRFAGLRERFTRQQLAALQAAARSHRERWLQARGRYGWLERSPAPQRPTHKPQAVDRRAVSRSPAPWRFLLHRSSPVAEAPSIGPRAAARLGGIGIRTVADLLNANPQSAADDVGEPRLTAETVARWQAEARLACRIPELRSCGAQLLAACGFAEPEQVAAAAPDELVRQVQSLCRTARGKRILGDGKTPTAKRIARWVQQAAHRRPLEAA